MATTKHVATTIVRSLVTIFAKIEPSMDSPRTLLHQLNEMKEQLNATAKFASLEAIAKGMDLGLGPAIAAAEAVVEMPIIAIIAAITMQSFALRTRLWHLPVKMNLNQ